MGLEGPQLRQSRKEELQKGTLSAKGLRCWLATEGSIHSPVQKAPEEHCALQLYRGGGGGGGPGQGLSHVDRLGKELGFLTVALDEATLGLCSFVSERIPVVSAVCTGQSEWGFPKCPDSCMLLQPRDKQGTTGQRKQAQKEEEKVLGCRSRAR